MLSLDIEWLMGVCYAARDPSDDAPDWPPQPDRIFSALVASWGARGCNAEERVALEWLEQQEPPLIAYCEGASRTPVKSYVPVNDKLNFEQVGGRSRQERQFPAMRLQDGEAPHLRLVWPEAECYAHLDALRRLANDTSYIGHSASVVRCRFSAADDACSDAKAALRAPYQGRLAELEVLFERHMKGDERARPRPSTRRGAASEKPEWLSPFGEDWIVLEHAGGDRPDLRAAALVGKAMRDALMSAWEGPIPEWLSGHARDGAPSADPHLAVAPLANVGWPWSDGNLMGLALIPPRAKENEWCAATPAAWEENRAVNAALARLRRGENEDAAIELTLGAVGVWKLHRAADYAQHSLHSGRYCRETRVWSSATPVALDRHLKSDGVDRLREAEDVIRKSCERLGLPPCEVRAHKHAAIQGAPAAWPPGGAPRWQNWARPASLKTRPLVHATLTFEDAVRGPILLGAGRFFGLGLFLPWEKRA
jgi:CRISPR-associated protein Csb2